MRGKRERLAQLLVRSGALDMVLRARAKSRLPVLTILTYHSVSDVALDYPCDAEVVDATPAQFRDHLELLQQRFNVIGVDELVAAYRGKSLPPNAAMITFDDGYRSCHDVVLPMLQEYGLRATFFIATEYVKARRLYWWDRINFLLKSTDKFVIEIDYPQPMRFDLRKADSIQRVLRVVKDQARLDLDRYLDVLTEASGVSWSDAVERELADRLIMNWDDIRRLRDAGMDVESHTRRHRVLQTLSPESLAEELAGSREDLERELGRPVRTVAYPVGHSVMGRPDICRAVSDAGYSIGFSNATGVNYMWTRPSPLNVKRIAVGRVISRALFHSMMAFPALAYAEGNKNYSVE